MKNNVFCTIFTPTYNRKELIKKLYESLCKQDDFDFEWLIVDDGSTDDTYEMLKELSNNENNFKIICKRKENGGKHRAINYGLDYANGKVFAIVDSDDYLTSDAVKRIKQCFFEIENEKNGLKYAGIAGQKITHNNELIGKTFEGNYVDAKSNERSKYNIEGDKFEVFYTEVLKNNKFPEFEGEKFMTESVVWTRIAKEGYYLRWYNYGMYVCEYLEGGLTDSREKLIRTSPKGYALYIQEQVEFGNISLKQKMGYYSFYYKIRKADGKNLKEVSKEININSFLLFISYVLRKIIENVRGE